MLRRYGPNCFLELLDPSYAQSWYLLGRPTWSAKNATKPTKRINRPCTEMGATPYLVLDRRSLLPNQTSSMMPLTLIRVRSE
jgi:hypothetical protein